MRPYRIARRSMPEPYRADHGDELLATALDLHDGRWSAREAFSLCRHGLRTRTAVATQGSPKHAIRQTIYSAIEVLAAALAGFFASAGFASSPVEVAINGWLTAGAGVATLIAIVIGHRTLVVGLPLLMIGVAAAANFGPNDPPIDLAFIAIGVQSVALVAAGLWAVHAGVRRHRLRTVAVALAIFASGATLGHMTTSGMTFLIVAALGLVGIALVPIDPRPLLVAGWCWLWQRLAGIVFAFENLGDSSQQPTLLTILAVDAAVVAALIALSWFGLRRLRPAL